ncbi:hypothetical protein PROFUN_07200 [Planoprotostelium fungivorum]|uniref:AB hydrolase-1 domain-containing protein n=1 Tax=Planoprotostelium fungivorum TaxID=1890364 RepID=A0A2P6NMG6_9EUKA|nr:hypothetical protein PROFUN_07200 [Planoprotostelium fungivorum]
MTIVARTLILTIRAVPWVLFSVLLLSFIEFITSLDIQPQWLFSLEHRTTVGTIIIYWSLFECIFFLYRIYHQRHLPSRTKWTNTKDERAETFRRCFDHLPTPDAWLGWFLDAQLCDIQFDNIAEWLCFALFNLSMTELQYHPNTIDLTKELHHYIQLIEEKMDHKFPPGYNDKVTSMRLNLDHVPPLHRPLLIYLVISLLDTFSQLQLFYKGYTHFVPDVSTGCRSYFPPTISYVPGLFRSSGSTLHYWYRPPTDPSQRGRAVVFVGGIGAGIYGAKHAIVRIAESSPGSPTYIVDNLAVGMRYVNYVPTPEETLEGVEKMLNRSERSDCVFIGLSLGSTLGAWLIRMKPSMVTHCIMVDPVCFMLHLPDVAYNFVYKQPKTANDWVRWYFVGREETVLSFLRNHFIWNRNILWKDQVPQGGRSAVFLSEEDSISPVHHVWTELTGRDVPRDDGRGVYIDEGNITTHWNFGLKHGQSMFIKRSKDIVVRLGTQFAKENG